MTCIWKIELLETSRINPDQLTAHWRVNAGDGNMVPGVMGEPVENQTTAYGTQEIGPEFAGETEAAVITAVQDSMGAERVAKIEAGLEQALAERLAPSPPVAIRFDQSGSPQML